MARGLSGGGRSRWPRPHWADIITATGLALTIHEAVLRNGPERPGIQFMLVAMMGLSPVVRLDEKRAERKRDGGQAPADPPSRSSPPNRMLP